MARILFIEDEAGFRMTVGDRLRSEGHEVTFASRGDDGYRVAAAGGFDLILLDLMLPGKDGLDIARDLRARGARLPVLMLTARDDVPDRVIGLKLGADDYLCKPFDMRELLARIEALLRRFQRPVGETQDLPDRYGFGRITVDFGSAVVTRDGEPVGLTAQEYRLLAHFIARRGRLLSRAAILDEVWGYEAMVATRTVDVHVAALRQKVEDNPAHPRWIVTMRGMGYRFTG